MKKFFVMAALLFATSTAAHEMTPTYPELKPSYVEGILVAKLNLWNRRQDVSYYEIKVFDQDFNPIRFAAVDRILKLNYLDKTTFDVYIRKFDVNRVKYICTESKLLKSDVQSTGIKSMICSKIK